MLSYYYYQHTISPVRLPLVGDATTSQAMNSDALAWSSHILNVVIIIIIIIIIIWNYKAH